MRPKGRVGAGPRAETSRSGDWAPGDGDDRNGKECADDEPGDARAERGTRRMAACQFAQDDTASTRRFGRVGDGCLAFAFAAVGVGGDVFVDVLVVVGAVAGHVFPIPGRLSIPATLGSEVEVNLKKTGARRFFRLITETRRSQ